MSPQSSTLPGIPCIRFLFRRPWIPLTANSDRTGTITAGPALYEIYASHWGEINCDGLSSCPSLLFGSSLLVRQWGSLRRCTVKTAQVYLVFARLYASVPGAVRSSYWISRTPSPPTVPSRQKARGDTAGNCHHVPDRVS